MDDFIIVAMGGLVTAALVFVVLAFLRRRKTKDAVEIDFRNTFMTTSDAGKEALIKGWMERKKCSRLEAMRLAVDEWRRENRSWR